MFDAEQLVEDSGAEEDPWEMVLPQETSAARQVGLW